MILEVVGFIFLFIISSLILANFSTQKVPPGPPALPVIGHLHLLRPIAHQSLRKLSSRYGPIISVRIGALPAVVVSTPELTKEFLKTNDAAFSARHGFHSVEYMSYQSSFAFAPFGNFTKFMRKFSIFKLLGSQTIAQLTPIRAQEFKYFLRVFHEKAKLGESINVSQELMKLTNNIISQMIWSKRPTDMVEQSVEAWTIVRDTTQVFGELNVANLIPFFKYFDVQGFAKRYKETHRRFDSLVERIITEREEVRRKRKEGVSSEGDKEVKDFLELMLDLSEDDGSEMKITRKQLKALILDFFTAGTDSAAVAIEWALAELINHPSMMKRAQKEIEEVVGPNRLVSESDCANLPYIQAIIKETLRLHPPIPLLLRKAVQSCEVSGYKIPVGTILLVNVWAMGRDPEYWENPMEFKPERFLKSEINDAGSNNVDVKGQHFQYLPFGTGRRVCVAIPLAMQELYTSLAVMIQCFNWKVVDPDGKKLEVVDMSEKPGITAPRAKDLLCVPIPRLAQYDFLSL